MKKSQRLNVIVELNAKNEQTSLKALGEIQKKRQEAEKQLENLNLYRQDYQTQYRSVSETGVNIKQLQEFRAFMSKVDKAILEQQQTINSIEKQIFSARIQWEQHHQKTKSLQKVSDAALKNEQKEEEKREQNEQDDRVSRGGLNSGIGNA